jgi:hypothetical protein
MNIAAFLFIAATLIERAPEECLVLEGKAVATATHADKTYRFRYTECRDQFLTDPDRYAQLYDALLELAAEGVVLEAPSTDESLVPS